MMTQYANRATMALLTLLAAILGACSPKGEATDQRPVVTVTIEPLRLFTEVIAGERWRVVSMVPQGNSPETYDPTPQQLVELERSRAYLLIGHIGFERTWKDRMASNAPQLPMFDTSEGVDLIRGGHRHEHAHQDTQLHSNEEKAENGHSIADDDLSIDPHIWNSPRNARIIARNVAEALKTIDPEGEAVYKRGLDSLCLVIDRTDSVVRTLLAQPNAGRTFLIYHPALTYFARDYGLNQIAIENEGKEPTPAHLAELIETCRSRQVRVVFVQPEFDQRNAALIAQQTGSTVIPINPLAYDWSKELVRTAQALTAP